MNERKKHKTITRPEQLLSLFRAGDSAALKQLYDIHCESLLIFCNRLLDDHCQAEEVVMDTFVKLWQHRSQFKSLSSIVHYIFAVSKNACIDQLRKRKVIKSNQDRFTYFVSGDSSACEAELIRAQLYQLALLEAEHFPPKMKLVFMMIFRDGLSPQQTADALGVSVETVKTHRKFALKVLRQTLAKSAFHTLLFLFF